MALTDMDPAAYIKGFLKRTPETLQYNPKKTAQKCLDLNKPLPKRVYHVNDLSKAPFTDLRSSELWREPPLKTTILSIGPV